MSKIKQLTQAIRNHAECELDYGTVRTLKMIDEEADRLETQLQSTSSNSDYAKCSHVVGLICGVLDITISECDELNLHEIYHKIVEIKNVVKELSQHFA